MFALSHTTPLEDIRNLLYETRAEFARRLGITEQTYRRLLAGDARIENPTKRQVAARLNIPPHLIAELAPRPTAARLASLADAITAANATGDWYRLEEDGSFTHAPDAVCPPGAA